MVLLKIKQRSSTSKRAIQSWLDVLVTLLGGIFALAVLIFLFIFFLHIAIILIVIMTIMYSYYRLKNFFYRKFNHAESNRVSEPINESNQKQGSTYEHDEFS